VRQPWARGVEIARPDPAKIESLLFPPPGDSEDLSGYIDKLTEKLSSVLSGLIDVWQPVQESLPERIPSSGRIQFLVQEQFDCFGGRYFHFVVPSPDEALHSESGPEDRAHKPARKRSNEKRVIAALQDQHSDVPTSGKANAEYVKFINDRLSEYCRTILEGISVAGETAAKYYQRISDLSASVGGFSSGVGPYESIVREDFGRSSAHFHNLQVIELAQC